MATESLKLEAWGWKPEAGGLELETGSWRLDSRLSTPLPLTHRIWREIVRFICLKHLKDGHKFNLNDSKVADFVFLEVVVDHVDS